MFIFRQSIGEKQVLIEPIIRLRSTADLTLFLGMEISIDNGIDPYCAVSRYTIRKGYDIKDRPFVKRASILFSPVTRSFFVNLKRSIYMQSSESNYTDKDNCFWIQLLLIRKKIKPNVCGFLSRRLPMQQSWKDNQAEELHNRVLVQHPLQLLP